ncbi:MAG: hypothetical protein R6U44_01190 [Archaeoglobaceae archaeon]
MVKGNPLDAAMVTLLVNALIYVPLSILLYFPHFGLTYGAFLAFGTAGLLASFLVRILVYTGTKPSFDLLIPLGAMLFSGLARAIAKVGLLEGTPSLLVWQLNLRWHLSPLSP